MTMSNKPAVKPTARLDASLLLARKGEASPAVAATQHNNPGLAWGAPAHPADFQPQSPAFSPAHIQVHAQARLRPDSFFAHAHAPQGHGVTHMGVHGSGLSARSSAYTGRTRASAERDPVALTMRVEDETYLRLKYLAQHTGRSTQQVLAEALDDHLLNSGVPSSRKLVVKPE